MSPTNFQTVRLGRGTHRSPEDGACVMELASMIAGEPFTDRPRSVCRVIAAMLRAYNDVARDAPRQDLYRCASEVVGTRASHDVEAERLAHCIRVLGELRVARARSLSWRLRSPAPRRLMGLVESPKATGQPVDDFMYGLARILRGGGVRGHERALTLVDELIAIREAVPEPAPALAVGYGPSHATSVASMS